MPACLDRTVRERFTRASFASDHGGNEVLSTHKCAFFRLRRAACAGMVVGMAVVGALGQSSSTTGRPSQLPPPPTIDTNVNQNETLANVRYTNKYEIYAGPAFSHFNAGPSLIQGSNLGGFDVQGTRWLLPRWGATANVRGYYGTNGVYANPYGIRGPLVFEHLFLGGPTYRTVHNEHAAIDLHALFGVGLGDFQHAIDGVNPALLGLFSNGSTFATALGGSLDLNRSPRLAFRLSPDYILTRYGGVNQNEFGISVGILYRFRMDKGPKLR